MLFLFQNCRPRGEKNNRYSHPCPYRRAAARSDRRTVFAGAFHGRGGVRRGGTVGSDFPLEFRDDGDVFGDIFKLGHISFPALDLPARKGISLSDGGFQFDGVENGDRFGIALAFREDAVVQSVSNTIGEHGRRNADIERAVYGDDVFVGVG